MDQILVIGDLCCPEFKVIRQFAKQRNHVTHICLPHELPTRNDFGLVLIAKSRPGEFSDQYFVDIRSLFPPSMVCLVYGIWCEGEPFAARPLADLERIAWHQLANPGCPLIRALDSGFDARLWTNSKHQEKIRSSQEHNQGPHGHEDAALILSDDAESAFALADACRMAGLASNWRRYQGNRGAWDLGRQYVVVLWDVRLSLDRQPLAYHSMAKCPKPIVVIASFLRAEDQTKFYSLGARDVLPKPYAIDDLAHRIQDAVSKGAREASDFAA